MLDADRTDLLDRYACLVESSPHNLMSPRGLAELRERHIPESLALAGTLPPGPARVVDVGSGGGLPGLVVALVRPDLQVTLVESTKKKARFLAAAADELGVRVEVIPERAEWLAEREPAGFDLATARAVAPLDRLVPLVLPLLRPGGSLYAVKGRAWAEELDNARAVLTASGAEVVSTPDEDGTATAGPRVVIIAATAG